MQIFADYHTHTRYSHGTGTISDNVRAARQKRLTQVGITDHGPANLFGVGAKSLAVLDRVIEEVRVENEERGDITVLAGVEANIIDLDGTLDVPGHILRRLDIVQAGLHLLVKPASLSAALVFLGNLLGQSFPWLRRRLRRFNTQMVINAVRRGGIDVVTHPGLRVDIDTVALAEACAQFGTALEINSSHNHINVAFVKAAAQTGVKFVIGSDAHSPERVGDFERGLLLAQEAGLSPSQILNAGGEGLAGRRAED